MKSSQQPPDYQELDTYNADLLNENPPRSEVVTEIQDRKDGHLLCYASPDRAAFIVRACNNHDALVEALKACELTFNAIGSDLPAWAIKTWRTTEAALAAAEGGSTS